MSRKRISSIRSSISAYLSSKRMARLHIPLKELRSQPEFIGKRVTVGVAVAATIGSKGSKKLLLLQRAANEDACPNMYELPGGNTEEEDKTIHDTVVRELSEETGLKATNIVGEFDDGFEYTTRRGASKQLNFLVNVPDNPKVTLNPEEHQAYAWIGADDSLDGFPMTDAMKRTVAHALRAVRS